MPAKRINYKDVARQEWGKSYEVDQHGQPITATHDEIMVGLLYRILDAIPSMAATEQVLAELQAIRKLLTPRPAPPPADDKAAREEASRRRAWAAYKKAGGTMSSEGYHADPTVPVPVWDAASEAWALFVARRVAWRKANACACEVCKTEIHLTSFSSRVRKALYRLDVATVGEVRLLTAEELQGCKNFGDTSLREVRTKLAALGLWLSGEAVG